MNFLRRKTLALGGAFVGLALSNRTAAQSFPDRPIKIIISVPPGGGVDLWARIVTAKLEKLLGQPIVFDYRPGGGTVIGAIGGASTGRWLHHSSNWELRLCLSAEHAQSALQPA